MIKSILSDTEMKCISKLELALAGSPDRIAIELHAVIKNLLGNEKGIKVVNAVMTYNSDKLIDNLNLEDSEMDLLVRRIKDFDTYNSCN